MKTPEELAHEGRVVEAFDSILNPVTAAKHDPEEVARIFNEAMRGMPSNMRKVIEGLSDDMKIKFVQKAMRGLKGAALAFDTILDQELPLSTLALPPEELAKFGQYKAAYEAILAAAEPMSPEDFVKALEGKLQIKDRRVQPKVSGDTIYINFYNMPKSLGRGGGGGAEAENNRMMFIVRFKDENAKAKVELSVNALDQKYSLRAKTGHPAKIADYLAAHINKVVKEVEPNLTHSYEREDKSAAELAKTNPGAAFDMILACGSSCNGNCECQGDCDPIALVKAGHVKEAFEAILTGDHEAATKFNYEGEMLSFSQLVSKAKSKEARKDHRGKVVYEIIMKGQAGGDATVFAVTKRQWEGAKLKDETSPKMKAAIVGDELKKLTKGLSMSDAVDYNTWAKKENPSDEKKLEWLRRH